MVDCTVPPKYDTLQYGGEYDLSSYSITSSSTLRLYYFWLLDIVIYTTPSIQYDYLIVTYNTVHEYSN